MDKATIETAYLKSSLVQDTDFVDNFIRKTVQIPVNIPDPTDEEWVEFLNTELLRKKDNDEKRQSEDLASSAQSRIDGGNGGEPQEAGGPSDIESGARPIKWEGCCFTFFIDWLMPRLKGITSCFLPFIAAIRYIVCFLLCNIRDETQNQRDSKEGEQRLRKFKEESNKILSERIRQVRDTLMLSYSDEEVITFHSLKSYATGIPKVPREWKSYMNYHKFARNVVSQIAKIKKIPCPVGWEVEFVAWTFVCSQWKHEINALIEDWYNYAAAKGSPGGSKFKSSLKEIVANYIEQRNWEEQTGCQVKLMVEENTERQLGKKAGKQVFIVSNSTQSSSDGSMKKEQERWENLRECLENVHDVSLEGFRCFQHFRYHCDARNLVSELKKQKRRPSNYPFESMP